MAKRAKANGKIEDVPVTLADGTDAVVQEVEAAEQPKRGRGRPRKERSTNGPTPEQEAETLAELIRLDTESARIAQAKSTVLNRFEKFGGDKKVIKAVKSLLMQDKREAQAYLEKLFRTARNAEIEIKVSWSDEGQAELTDVLDAAPSPKNTEGTRDLAAARAHNDGYNSGLNGAAPSDNPFAHKPGSEEYVQWHDGRDSAQRDRESKSGLTDRIAASVVADASLPTEKPADVPF